MNETGVDNAVGLGSATAQAFQIFQVAVVNFRTGMRSAFGLMHLNGPVPVPGGRHLLIPAQWQYQ
jgi:hypothetical protein